MFFTNGDTGRMTKITEPPWNRPAHGQGLRSIRATCSAFEQTHADLLTAAYEHPATARGKPVVIVVHPAKGTALDTGIAGLPAPWES